MRRVLALADPIQAGYLHAVLEEAGIPCILRNHFLGGAAGELPLNECWPEIWVLENADADRARGILNEHVQRDITSPSGWRCGGCGETLEAQFIECWNCGKARAEGHNES
jgi:hypothetical protein